MSAGDKAINYLSMIFGGLLGLVIGIVIYNRTMARAKELALEAAGELGAAGTLDGTAAEYADLEAGLLDPEDAAALMDDDDISLWENDGYRDEEELDREASDGKADEVKGDEAP
jgi:hypothetical protein